ncbi:MAG: hypothetical protein O3A81_01970 [bacterium]|nr:hypothetical protein [bacterium]
MFSGMTDFGRKRTLSQAIIFALYWGIIQIFFAMVSGALLAVFMTLILNGNPIGIYGGIFVNFLGTMLIPVIISFQSVYRKWGAGNMLNILLYILVTFVALSPWSMLNIIFYVVFAMRPSCKSVPTRFKLLLLLAFPITLVILMISVNSGTI